MELFAKYHPGNPIEPLTSEDFRKSLRLKDSDFIRIETWKERNLMFHRKYFALLNCSIHHFPEDKKFDPFRNVNYLRKELMIAIGECEKSFGLDGKEHISPKSIAFNKMDEEEFDRVYSMSLNVLLKYFLIHLSLEDFVNDIQNFI